MQNSTLTHWNSELSRAAGRRWLAVALFVVAFASYLVPMIRRGELNQPPAPGGDEPDYDAIALQLARGNGFSVDWDDDEYRALYARAASGQVQVSVDVPSHESGSRYSSLFERHGASPTAIRPPVLPALLATTYRIVGRQFAPIRVINCACLALACTLVFLFVFARFGALPGLLATGLFLTVEPRLRLYPQAVLTECLG